MNKLYNLVFILLSFFLINCSADPEQLQTQNHPAEEESSESSQETVAPPSYTCACYYYMNDKYLEEYDSLELAIWQDSILQLALEKAIPSENSLFNHEGGGPMGAEWNSDAHLYCLANISDKESITVYLNKSMTEIPLYWHESTNDQYIITFNISSEEWTNALKPIDKSDFPLLYSQSGIDTFLNVSNSPLGVGKILIISLLKQTNQDTLHLNGFHIAYGE